jgi:hypothetical protein
MSNDNVRFQAVAGFLHRSQQLHRQLQNASQGQGRQSGWLGEGLAGFQDKIDSSQKRSASLGALDALKAVQALDQASNVTRPLNGVYDSPAGLSLSAAQHMNSSWSGMLD